MVFWKSRVTGIRRSEHADGRRAGLRNAFTVQPVFLGGVAMSRLDMSDLEDD